MVLLNRQKLARRLPGGFLRTTSPQTKYTRNIYQANKNRLSDSHNANQEFWPLGLTFSMPRYLSHCRLAGHNSRIEQTMARVWILGGKTQVRESTLLWRGVVATAVRIRTLKYSRRVARNVGREGFWWDLGGLSTSTTCDWVPALDAGFEMTTA